MISKKILSYLEKNKIFHEIVSHKKVFTARDLAATLKEKTNKIAKTLLVKVGGKKYILVIVPANLKLDFNKIKKALKIDKAELATEKAIAKVLKLKPGTVLPFGSLYKLEILIDKALLKTEKVLVGAGTFTESLRLKVKDLVNVEKATVADIGAILKVQAIKTIKKIKSASKKLKKGKS